MKTCENCGCEHDGSYTTGRFCSAKCRYGFSTKSKRAEINEKVRNTRIEKYGTQWIDKECEYCGNIIHAKITHKKPNAPRCCSQTCYNKLPNPERSLKFSIAAKNRGFGGNRNNRAFGWYESPFAGRVYLESSYEHKVALSLDENEINWTRPTPINWVDDNLIVHKYFPDFYLVDYDIYLDPKNSYLQKVDKLKIEKVKSQNNVKVLVLSKDELNWKTILTLI